MLFPVQNFGAVPDGTTLNTQAIQNAIDACSAAGGGSVILSDGTFLSGTIILKNNVDLHLEADGVLLGSPNCGRYAEPENRNEYRDFRVAEIADYGDYPDFEKRHVRRESLPRSRGCALIFAEECQNISITGKGAIDANGEMFIEKIAPGENYWQPYGRIYAPTPPRVVFFTGCRNVLVEGVTVRNQPAGWSFWLHDCDLAAFDKVKILANVDYPNNDGIHINCCRDVTVSNCVIHCGDDSLVVRANSISLKENRVCERIAVSNCTLISHASGIRIGWVNDGIIRNCTFSNLTMTDTVVGIDIHLPVMKWAPTDHGREETLIENLSFSAIVMDRILNTAVQIKIAEDPAVRCRGIRDLYFSNLHARGKNPPNLHGRPGNPIENISFQDCSFECSGEGHSPVMQTSHVKYLAMNNTRFSF